MVFYQPDNSVGNFYYNAYLYENCDWKPHFHRNPELVLVREGAVNATIDGKAHEVKKGQALLVLPDQIHAYHTPASSLVWISVFSPDHVPGFHTVFDGKAAPDPVFSPGFFIEGLWDKITFFTKADHLEDLWSRSLIYTFAAEEYAKRGLVDAPASPDDFAHRVVEYVEAHYREESFTMKQTAAYFGYDYHYFSRRFSAVFHTGFRAFVNEFRYQYVSTLLENPAFSVSLAAGESGFGSVRNFNRVKSAHTEKKPRKGR